jgi:hypothetical protein
LPTPSACDMWIYECALAASMLGYGISSNPSHFRNKGCHV